MGSSLPQLSKAQTEDLEPLVTAGGAEYAERVHKLGRGGEVETARFMQGHHSSCLRPRGFQKEKNVCEVFPAANTVLYCIKFCKAPLA